MLEYLGQQRFVYTAGQRRSSDHVHGTWVGLRNHYIELADNGVYHTKLSSPTHVNQYVYITYVVLDALRYFVNYVFVSCETEKETLLNLFKDTANEISGINDEIIGLLLFLVLRKLQQMPANCSHLVIALNAVVPISNSEIA